MSHELRDGISATEIRFGDDSYHAVNVRGCQSITIREQAGQMGMVPWLEVIYNDRRVLVNASLTESITLTPTG